MAEPARRSSGVARTANAGCETSAEKEKRALSLAKDQVRTQFGVDPDAPAWQGLVLKFQRALLTTSREG